MKKFNFKSLLVLVLALILVFSLVACNKDSDNGSNNAKPPKPAEYTASEYFGELWNLTASIGNESVKDENIKISADLGVALNLKTDEEVKNTIDLGIGLEAVLDRKSGTSEDTAVKLNLYDPSNNKENWATLYYFVGDPYYIYVDFAGQNIKIGLDTEDGNGGEIADKDYTTHGNEYLGTWINDMVMNADEGAKSINDYICMFTDSMGSDWTLNTLINKLVELLGVDLKELLQTDKGIGGTIAKALVDMLEDAGIKSVDELFDATGSLKIDTILTSGLLDSFFKASKDGSTYTAMIDESVLSLVSMLEGSLPISGLSNLLDKAEIALTFVKANNEIGSFTISAGLPAISTEIAEEDVYPEVAITISNLKVRKATTENAIKLAKEKSKYDDQFDLKLALSLDVDGIYVYDYSDSKIVDLSGKYSLVLDGTVDLIGKADANKTKAYAYIAKDNEKIIEASYNKGTIVVKANSDVMLSYTDNKDNYAKAKELSALEFFLEKNQAAICDFLDAFVHDDTMTEFENALNADFVGKWTGIEVQESLSEAFWSLFPEENDGKESADKFDLSIIANVIKKAMPLISTTGNKLTLKSNDIGATIVGFTSLFEDGFEDVEDISDAIIKADTSEVMDSYVLRYYKAGSLGFKPAKDYGYDVAEIYYVFNEGESKYEVKAIEDETEFDSNVDDLFVYDDNYISASDFFMDIFNSEVAITLDLSAANGAKLSVSVIDEEISAEVELSISMAAYKDATFVDLSSETADFIFDFKAGNVVKE